MCFKLAYAHNFHAITPYLSNIENLVLPRIAGSSMSQNFYSMLNKYNSQLKWSSQDIKGDGIRGRAGMKKPPGFSIKFIHRQPPIKATIGERLLPRRFQPDVLYVLPFTKVNIGRRTTATLLKEITKSFIETAKVHAFARSDSVRGVAEDRFSLDILDIENIVLLYLDDIFFVDQ